MNNLLSTETNPAAKTSDLYREFKNFVLHESHPCLMAKAVFSSEQIDFRVYEGLGDKVISQRILNDLDVYIPKALAKKRDFYSFVAAFPNLNCADEAIFEERFWAQLQLLHDLDFNEWDTAVSDNPADTNFSFSLRGHAFYLIGMHPNSSRMARQAPYPAIVFNLHSQFEQLRNMGAYQKVRNKIRERDLALQGSNNPMLADFGEVSEARQYSGKETGAEWKCPFSNHYN